ncbi:MAG: MerR family transcriptional regulator [Opitutae bacterium]|nr:MerR family transcriptional regulator [Opitutae bacterium]
MTIGLLAKKHGLSRSTLLYYDRIGLLRPGGRLHNDYRHYTAADEKRLGQICLYRRTGLPLAEIAKILGRPRQALAGALERQLRDLAEQIDGLRSRQRVIVELLKHRRMLESVKIQDKTAWVKLLRDSGFKDEDLARWHRDFERLDPDYHQRFLEFLGIPAEEIAAIRAHSRRAPETVSASGRGRSSRAKPD